MKHLYVKLCSLLLLTWAIASTAQPANTNPLPISQTQAASSTTLLKGLIQDASTQLPLGFATVSLHSAADSLIVAGTVTDDDGIFRLEAPQGQFYLVIDFLAYQTKIIGDLNIKTANGAYDLGTIDLEEKVNELEEIEVIGEKSQMELKLDKRVFNVGKDLTNAGSNAAEILDNVPSVQVDIEGNVSLRGSENVRILINGKPSGLVGISSNDALRQMQGDLIERVEVITNPSARYEAEGEVGIINIVLKKERRKGINGSFGLTTGVPANYGASYSLNFRRKKFNLFSNFGVNYRDNPGRGFDFQRFTDDAGNFTFRESERDHSRARLGGNIRVGTDWMIDDKNTLTGSLLLNYSEGENETTIQFQDLDGDQNPVFSRDRFTVEEEEQYNIEAEVNYRKIFSSDEHSLTVDFRFQESDDTELADYTEINDTLAQALIERSSNTEDERNILIQADYVHPFSENSRFEAGLRTSLRTIDNNFLVEEQVQTDEYLANSNFNDVLQYLEDIYAAYLIYGSQIDQFSYQVGLRAEYTDIETALIRSGETNPRSYLDWFPTVHLAYEFSSKDQFQLSYSRRISRPRFRHLLPFSNYSDNQNFWAGNPDLNPEYSNSYEVGYLKYWEKGSLLSSVYYRHRNNVIERIRIENEDQTTVRFPINLATQNSYGFEFSYSYTISKWWRLNTNANFFRAITEGTYEDQEFNADTYTLSGRLNTQLTLFKKMDIQTSINYRAPRINPQGRTQSMYSVNLGISKDILNKKGTLTLSATDLFNTRIRRSILDDGNLFFESEFQWRSRQVRLNFSYRLNQKKRRSRNGAKKRIGTGEGDRGDF